MTDTKGGSSPAPERQVITTITPDQVELFRSLFYGRQDVYAEFWENKAKTDRGFSPACANKWKPKVCALKAGGSCKTCQNVKPKPLDEVAIRKHLTGQASAGNYVLREGDVCCLVAADFDNHLGTTDPRQAVMALAEVMACNDPPLPFRVFASKSGKGYHFYVFINGDVEAWKVRAVFHALLKEAQILDDDHVLDDSFDRIFPNQDHLTGKGFGSLIALPFIGIQYHTGTSLMLDPDTDFLEPYTDQWGELSMTERIDPAVIEDLVQRWDLTPSRKPRSSRKKTTGSARARGGGSRPGGASGGAGSGSGDDDSEMESLIDRVLSGDIKKGERDETIFKIACRQRGKGLSKREVEFFCCSLVDRCCQQTQDDPYTHEDALAKVESAWKYEPNEDADDARDPTLPTIRQAKFQLPTVINAAWEAIMAKNDPPELFVVDDKVVRIRGLDDGSPPIAKPLDVDEMRGYLTMAANWEKVVKKIPLPDRPSPEVCRGMLVCIEKPLPRLDRIVTAPFFARDGSLHATRGYSDISKCFLSTDIDVGTIPAAPSETEVAEARAVILDTVVDFPFTGDADRAHAISLMLLPFARGMIDGATPMHLFEAPMPRTGKSLLVAVCLSPFLGDRPKSIGEGYDPAELEKVLLATLQELPSYVFIDNVAAKLAGSALARALTEPYWRGRIMRKSKMVGFPIHCAWAMTANNPSASKELAGRTIRIRLDAKCAQPGRRRTSDFQHPDIIRYVREHRVAIVRSCLILTQNWIAKGRPLPAHDTPSFGSFEKWRDVMGGILAVNGIPGFLTNMADAYEVIDSEGASDERFVAAWWERYDSTAVLAKDLWEVNIKMDEPVVEESLLDSTNRTQMGKYLSKLRDRTFDIDGAILRVEHAGTFRRAVQWRLKIQKLVIEPKQVSECEVV